MEKEEVIKRIMTDFDYTKKELLKWDWINVEATKRMTNNVFFDGAYVLFADDKIVWY